MVTGPIVPIAPQAKLRATLRSTTQPVPPSAPLAASTPQFAFVSALSVPTELLSSWPAPPVVSQVPSISAFLTLATVFRFSLVRLFLHVRWLQAFILQIISFVHFLGFSGLVLPTLPASG